MVKRFALVRISDGAVVNVCVWDGVTPWNDLPAGVDAAECPDEVGPGWSYIDGKWIAPEPPPELPPER
jgi:hypothetical protein